ncbi:hypothetical protein Tco_0842824 [Tanacetum coccineum]|uniref:Uncharacterized protein n=1 Tax=Tanacetum coccineum TaxID=301880 RepID=A0ABQ5B338_9ASTR
MRARVLHRIAYGNDPTRGGLWEVRRVEERVSGVGVLSVGGQSRLQRRGMDLSEPIGKSREYIGGEESVERSGQSHGLLNTRSLDALFYSKMCGQDSEGILYTSDTRVL